MARKRKRSSNVQKLQKIILTTPTQKQNKKAENYSKILLCLFIVIIVTLVSAFRCSRPNQTTLVERTTPAATENKIEIETVTSETETVATETEKQTEPAPKILHFIVNAETGCVHISSHCSAAESISTENRKEIDIPDNELSNYSGVYWACGKCCSGGMRSTLPKPE